MNFFKKILYETKLGRKLKILKNFKRIHGYKMDFKNPNTFNSKIQWIKVYGKLERFAPLVDKYEVRKYVAKKNGANYLINQYGIYKDVDSIDFNFLPKKFVLKATHGAGWVRIVKNKDNEDINEIKKELEYWLNQNHYLNTGEPNYKYINPRIIIEKYLEGEEDELNDYKFHCTEGKVRYIQVNKDGSKTERAFYDRAWQKTTIQNRGNKSSYNAEKPRNYNEMVKIAESLSKEFPYVRVDLYDSPTGVFFGELTFTPGNGNIKYNTKEMDEELGRTINVEKYNNSFEFETFYQ